MKNSQKEQKRTKKLDTDIVKFALGYGKKYNINSAKLINILKNIRNG